MISIWLPGKPVAKGRPRFARTKVGVRSYSPDDTLEAEEKIKRAYEAASGTKFEGPVDVTIHAYREMPKSIPKKRRATAMPDTRPDVDNYLKLVMDALNGLAWKDDAQVCRVVVSKTYAGGGLELGLLVTVSEAENP